MKRNAPARGKGLYLFRDSGCGFSGNHYPAFQADPAPDDRAGAGEFVINRFHADFLCGAEPDLGEEGEGGQSSPDDCDCSRLGISPVRLL